METALLVVGFALIAAALMQFAFWTGRLVRMGQMERRKFETELCLLKAQLDEITARRKSNNRSEKLNIDSAPPVEQDLSVAEYEPISSDGDTWTGFRNFRVAKLVPESANAMSVYLQPVESFLLPTYKPGQHLTVRMKIPGCEKPVVRCYTISNAPGQDYYRLTIKRALAPEAASDTAPGLVSCHVNERIAEGDVVEVKPPSGKFWLAPGDSPIVLLAGGIGITPMMSILQHLATTKSKRQCLLLYGVRNGADVTFGKQLAALTKEHTNIHVINCFSKPLASDRPNEDFQVRGYVSIELLQRVLPSHDFEFYLCGPPPFMNSIYNGLVDWGVPDSRMQFEAFGPATIKRRAHDNQSFESKPQEQTSGKSVSIVKLARSGKQLEWSNQELALLELCEEHGISIDSGCRSGNCRTCETRLISGSIRYEEEHDCATGCILPCIAKANGPLEIDA